jgi:hypothetical protein
MKKLCMVFVFVVLGARIFAFDYQGAAEVKVYPNEPPLYYEFYSVDLDDITDLLALGLMIGGWTHLSNGLLFDYNLQIYENNTSLSQAVKNKMRQLAANVCHTTIFSDDSGSLIVNILMSNGTYTTISYEGWWIIEEWEEWE